jgi:hypothetical protein
MRASSGPAQTSVPLNPVYDTDDLDRYTEHFLDRNSAPLGGRFKRVGRLRPRLGGRRQPVRHVRNPVGRGSESRLRVHFACTSPIFGSRSLPSSVIDHRSERVNRADCRLSLRHLKHGSAIFGPGRPPEALPNWGPVLARWILVALPAALQARGARAAHRRGDHRPQGPRRLSQDLPALRGADRARPSAEPAARPRPASGTDCRGAGHELRRSCPPDPCRGFESLLKRGVERMARD